MTNTLPKPTHENAIDLLGCRVRETMYGLEGVAVAIAEQINGNVRVCIQPPRKDDKPTEPEWVDIVGIEVLDSAFTHLRVELPFSPINLGDTVVDTASKFSGVVIDRTSNINGCLQHGVIAEVEKPGKPTIVEYFDYARLAVVHDEHPVKDIPQARTGGLPTRGRP